MFAAAMMFGARKPITTMLLVQHDEDSAMDSSWGPIELARLEQRLGIKLYPYHEDFDGGYPALGGHMIKVEG
jgi:hypothetical protein